jgi:hypothetical protein
VDAAVCNQDPWTLPVGQQRRRDVGSRSEAVGLAAGRGTETGSEDSAMARGQLVTLTSWCPERQIVSRARL